MSATQSAGEGPRKGGGAVPDPVRIEGIGAGGAGVGHLADGRVVFVQRTAPGDLVEIELTRERKRWARARLVRVLDAGPGRRPPPCPHYARCGGCTLEHLTPEAQLEARCGIVRDALERIGGLRGLPELEMHPAPAEFRYRSRVTFSLRRVGRGRVVAGFHELETPGRILDIDGRCLLPEQAISDAWDELRGAWGEGASRLPEGRELRLSLRAIGQGRVVLLVEGGTASGESADADSAFLLDEVTGLEAIWHRPEGEAEAYLAAGARELQEERLGESIPVLPDSFRQVNRVASEALHALALDEVGAAGGLRVIDAYCGVGYYGRTLADAGADAVGIESDPAAVEVARSLAGAGFSLLEGRVEERLSDALPADVVILNPPRAGVEDGVMEALAVAHPARIVYVSCDPATLARDLGRLGEGYLPTRVQVVDLFPQTAHVETIVTLTARDGV